MHRRHRTQTIFGGGITHRRRIGRAPGFGGADYFGQINVEICHGQWKSLGRANNHSAKPRGIVTEPGIALFHDFGPPTKRLPEHLVGLLLRPAQAATFAKYLNIKAMLAPDRNGRCP